MSMDLSFHLLAAVVARTRRILSFEHVGLSVRKGCVSWKPLAHNLALVDGLPLIIFGVRTHLTDMQGWPVSSTSV